MGDYAIAVKYLLEHILNKKDSIINPPAITSKTCELGNKYSPEFVCTPFKYTLGTMIESLNMGADTLIQFGGGCRYGYYHELQRTILADLGYKCELINLISGGKSININKLLKRFKINRLKFIYYLFITINMVKYMDKVDDYIRINGCYIEDINIYLNIKRDMLKSFEKVNSLLSLRKKYHYYFKKMKNIPKKKKRLLK